MKHKDKRNATPRFTNAQIAGIALTGTTTIGLLGIGATQLNNPTSFVRQRISSSAVKTTGVVLTNAFAGKNGRLNFQSGRNQNEYM